MSFADRTARAAELWGQVQCDMYALGEELQWVHQLPKEQRQEACSQIGITPQIAARYSASFLAVRDTGLPRDAAAVLIGIDPNRIDAVMKVVKKLNHQPTADDIRNIVADKLAEWQMEAHNQRLAQRAKNEAEKQRKTADMVNLLPAASKNIGWLAEYLASIVRATDLLTAAYELLSGPHELTDAEKETILSTRDKLQAEHRTWREVIRQKTNE
ncbi:hypothetical protein NQX30_05515 [Candidatus Persebacteraceae bacterium Df01]|jgi:hypothetical protein|uniref:Uncharacterized protein n=1 Tax=Candidatus Doriopsillibacter californiensis TaxID=2970740 RepID=A0ABT7QMA6_9GAMM|nr:hypothetical protein [Candidatus Persebacteraceae bacterium Df01]